MILQKKRPLLLAAVLVLLSSAIVCGQSKPVQKIIITDVHIFNGKDGKLQVANILIENNIIRRISASPLPADKSAYTNVINGKGKYVIPGLIDAHAHTMMESIPLNRALSSDIGYVTLVAAHAAHQQLLRGFTTVRDLGGATFSLKKAIDEGIISGPRIYPSGAIISQTGGHGDFGLPTDVPRSAGKLSYLEQQGMVMIADGVNQVLLRVREQLRNGATQIKLTAGGGVSSNYDPLDVTQYTEEEIKAAVSAAENWGTYVTVHAYTPKAIQLAIRAGVKCIDHGQLADDATARLMAEKKIWWSLQPFLDDEDAIPFPAGSENREKQLEMTNGTDQAYKLAKKYQIKTAWGTDCLFDPTLAVKQGKQLAKLTRWYTPLEILTMATSSNAELLALSGPRNPYKAGKLGVIQEGAYADLIIVDGNPIENIQLIADPEKYFQVIIKNGIIYKNTLND
ncbi:metal-dependent hydrolase family protein [Chitinophaga nivalis]|uniref:Amidohydrolase family protein n=1 Tax=Chitinophaga nivalis TaxID=2991709 RepID=A0ABT3IH72_9BACT|nr:amidohydrolase family protein [Chitinophaga nivalis]MCW3467010.1 amidohydrolase family protein [Chitinophaga nivalis]MCW3483299.1 amidohydrolase family protein [Chitinophaga nivalis]